MNDIERKFEDRELQVMMTVEQLRVLNRLAWTRYGRVSESQNVRLGREAKALVKFLGRSDYLLAAHDRSEGTRT